VAHGSYLWPQFHREAFGNMDYFFFFTGCFVIFIFLFRRELLIEKGSFKIILVISVILFLIGLTVKLTELKDSMSGALLGPLLTLGLFHLCRKFFIKYYNREVKDTAFNFENGLAPDRAFNILYGTLAMFLLVLITAAMEKL
jgi:uncharacterized membrane protein